jgi:hypothetical protein
MKNFRREFDNRHDDRHHHKSIRPHGQSNKGDGGSDDRIDDRIDDILEIIKIKRHFRDADGEEHRRIEPLNGEHRDWHRRMRDDSRGVRIVERNLFAGSQHDGQFDPLRWSPSPDDAASGRSAFKDVA